MRRADILAVAPLQDGLGRGENHVKALLMAGALALSLSAQQAHSQQQAIPDAPKPQTTLPPVTPGIGADGASTSTPPATPADGDADQAPVGSTLPSSQKPAVAAQDSDPVPDAGAAPDLSAAKLPTLRLTSNFVEIPFTVKDSRHQLVPGITWRDVRVYENGLRQHMSVFTVDPIPLSIAIVIDQSLPHQTMEEVNTALGALPAVFAPYDSVAVFTYNNGPRMLTDYTAGTSPRLTAVVEQAKSSGRENMYYAAGEGLAGGINLNSGAESHINPLTSGGPGSPQGLSQQQVPREVHTLNDAILMAAESLTKSGPDRRRIVYVISDGKEYGSQAKQKDVIKYLQTNQISVYASLIGDSSLPVVGYLDHIHIPLMMRDNLLPYYVNATGGQTFAENRVRGLENSFQQITEQVRTQYTVGYYSHESLLDGKFRNVEIRVMRPNLDVIAKKGYYPTPKSTRANVAQTTPTTQP
jgi:VWFA-related protein